MRRRRNTQSSFDLFLDTVCNTFGGVLFIAILIVIQVRHTVEQPAQKTCSPEQTAELLQRMEELAAEIESATVLLESIRKTMPEPTGEEDHQIAATYSELLEKKNDYVAKKTERTRNYLAQVKENADLTQLLNEIKAKLDERKNTESQLTQTIQSLQSEQQALEQKTNEQRNLVRSLETEVAQKTDRVRDKQNPDNHSRKEELFLPKLQDAGQLRPFYLVLRFNRLYVVENRDDFDYNLNFLGTPKKSRGFAVDDMDVVKRQIRNTFQSKSPAVNYIGVFVYGDSVDSFYIIRDEIVGAGFRYELIPSPDDAPWAFGAGNGTTQIQ